MRNVGHNIIASVSLNMSKTAVFLENVFLLHMHCTLMYVMQSGYEVIFHCHALDLL